MASAEISAESRAALLPGRVQPKYRRRPHSSGAPGKHSCRFQHDIPVKSGTRLERRAPCGLAVALKTGAPIRSDDRGVPRPSRQHDSIARLQLDRLLVGTHEERDRAQRADEELRGGVLVRDISITRAVAPRMRLNARRQQSRARRVEPTLPDAIIGKPFDRWAGQSTTSAPRWISTSPSSRATPTIRSSGRSHGRISDS